jgi:excisionase family DNA binding protein
MDTLVVSVAEAAKLLGVSDDLLYEVVERGELPCVRFGRRRLIPRRALDLVIEAALAGFEPSRVATAVADHHAGI